MIVLKIIGIILAIIIILFLSILAIPINIVVENDQNNGVKKYIKILCFSIGDSESTSPFIKKLLNKTTSESDKSDKTKKEEKKKDKATDKKDKGKDTSITDIIGLVIEIIKQIVWSFSHVTLKKLSLYYIAGGTDPADTATKYGIACATIYPAISFIMSLMKVNNKKVNVNIKCDFNKEETVLDFHIAISIRIVFIVIAGLRLLFKEIVKKIKGNRNNG